MSPDRLAMRDPPLGSRAQALANGRMLLGSDPADALAQAREMLRRDDTDSDAHWLAAAALRRLARNGEAERHEASAITNSGHVPGMVRAAQAIAGGRLAEAEPILRARLADNPGDAAALRMLAEVAMRTGDDAEGQRLLTAALAIAPGFTQARTALAQCLVRRHRYALAIAEYDRLIATRPEHWPWRAQRAAALARIGRYDDALAAYAALVDGPATNDAPAWLAYGHVLKTVGRAGHAALAYRRALAIDRAFGDAWWSIANIKTAPFDDAELAEMRGLAEGTLPARSRVNLTFALGKALEDRGEAAETFAAYAEANRLALAETPHDPAWLRRRVDDIVARVGQGDIPPRPTSPPSGPAPVFVVGLPRSGSTLIEQILASHPSIEGTSELPYMTQIGHRLEHRALREGIAPVEALLALGDGDAEALGKSYLALAAAHRASGRPLFIDKTPMNWLFVPLILKVLPRARVIDARRHPMACCFSNFRQHFAQGQSFTYSLTGLGQFYRDYLRSMDHVDRIAPGRVLRVIHEDLVTDAEAEVRRMLDYLGLPFDPACLSFHENRRAVRTPSAEQVRRPLDPAKSNEWRTYDPWLGELRAALGDALETWRASPLRSR